MRGETIVEHVNSASRFDSWQVVNIAREESNSDMARDSLGNLI